MFLILFEIYRYLSCKILCYITLIFLYACIEILNYVSGNIKIYFQVTRLIT